MEPHVEWKENPQYQDQLKESQKAVRTMQNVKTKQILTTSI